MRKVIGGEETRGMRGGGGGGERGLLVCGREFAIPII
jgi:hypothetical protein